MKNHNRAVRRRHEARMYKKHYKEESRRCGNYIDPEIRAQEEKSAKVRARNRVSTRTPCSCMGCVSPRYTVGNGKEGLTFQERRAIDDLKNYD